MPSIHVWKSIEVARKQGGFAGQDGALPLWEMNKRELIEIVLRLGALNSGDCDSADAGARAALHEYAALQCNGIL